MDQAPEISVIVNGVTVTRRVLARQHLIDFLREDLGLTGSHVGCIEGLSDSGELAALQEAFHRRNAAQCGYCTPGMLVAAQDLVASNPKATREQIREHLSGNYCRCTGYQAIVDAIEDVLVASRKKP
jgi:carbon-monoxide dehydrogenase small subunit